MAETYTLIIGPFSSKCGNCGKAADPREARHDTVPGWNPAGGCGQRFVFVTSDYSGLGTEAATVLMRPDLVWQEARRG